MKDLVIIGAGGMGRSVYNLALQCEGYEKDYQIKGFLDDNLNALDRFSGYPPVVGKMINYQIQENDIFICSLGDITNKKKYIQKMLAQGAEFINLIHPTVLVNSNVKIGKGCIIDCFTLIGAETVIGDFTLIQVGVVVGHDVTIGNWTRVDCHSTLVGGTVIGEEVYIHTGAVINHNVKIGNRVCVGACSFVIRNVKDAMTVYGNPAKRLI